MSHIVHLGDCIAGMRSLADKSVDHVICDPPYEAEAHTLQRRTKETFGTQVGGGDSRGTCIKPVDFAPMTADIRVAVSREIARVARRWILVFCQAEAVGDWRAALVGGGAKFKRACIWVKPDGQPQLTGDRPGMGYESIVAAHADVAGRSRWNGGGKHGVFTVATKSDPDSARTGHPTQKPEVLMEMLIRDFTDPGDLVLDPFAGSGTTGVACKRLGRRFIGWELNEKYALAAQARIDATHEQLELVRTKAPKPKQAALL